MTETAPRSGASAALWVSTAAFTACFAVWTVFSIIGIAIKDEFGLSETELGLLVGTPILTGSIARLFLGMCADRHGGRSVFAGVMVVAAIACFLGSYADSYFELLIAALGIGIAGGSFPAGVAYVSKFYPPERQGLALGTFGAGNVGSAITKLAAPAVMLTMGWAAVTQIWAAGLLAMAAAFVLLTRKDTDAEERRKRGSAAVSLREQMAILGNVQVWRFSLYYFFVFGALSHRGL